MKDRNTIRSTRPDEARPHSDLSRRISPRDRLIVALDTSDVSEAERLITALGDATTFYKIGMELAYGGGLTLAPKLVAAGKRIFVDLKLHDIPNTVERATAQVAKLGATFLTIHAYPQTMRAAVAGASDSGLKLLAVTVLTSADDADLAEAGYAFSVKELVARRGAQAKAAKVAGLVASAAEAAMLRREIGDDMILVTPGIRPRGAGIGDQKRVVTPANAIADGADYLVVGRPITEAADPRRAAQEIVAEIAEAAG
jgi:orotidine-5'-phosphate decarboxylase